MGGPEPIGRPGIAGPEDGVVPGGRIKAAVSILAAAQALEVALGISFKAGLEEGHQGEIILGAEVDAPEGFGRGGR